MEALIKGCNAYRGNPVGIASTQYSHGVGHMLSDHIECLPQVIKNLPIKMSSKEVCFYFKV